MNEKPHKVKDAKGKTICTTASKKEADDLQKKVKEIEAGKS